MMSRRKAKVSQSDLTRFMKSARAAGLEDFRVEIQQADGSCVSIVATKLTPLPNGGDNIDNMIERLP
jgi:DNA-binding MurR/RpiR family transcriptional regulator